MKTTSDMTERSLCFRPWRSFLVILLGMVLTLYVLVEAGQAPFSRLALWVDANGEALGPYIQGLITRLVTNPIAIGMATIGAVLVVYAVIQAIGLLAGSANGTVAAFFRRISGRPGAVDDANSYRIALKDYGQEMLGSPFRLGLTIFPMVGFLGTVIGLSSAIRDLPAAVDDKAKLPPVLDSLYIAFDTTALGLVGAILCLLMVWVFDNAATD